MKLKISTVLLNTKTDNYKKRENKAFFQVSPNTAKILRLYAYCMNMYVGGSTLLSRAATVQKTLCFLEVKDNGQIVLVDNHMLRMT